MRRGRVLLAVRLLVPVPITAKVATSQSATGFRADDATNTRWPGGFPGGITLVDAGEPISSWQLPFTFPSTQQIAQGRGVPYSQSGSVATMESMPWNGNLTGPSSGCSDIKATCQKPMPDAVRSTGATNLILVRGSPAPTT